MSSISCQNCGTTLRKRDEYCPACGHATARGKKWWLVFLIGSIVLFGSGYILFSALDSVLLGMIPGT